MPTVQTGDIETYYVRRGDGPPIVFVHGMIMSTTMWVPQMNALSDAFTTVAYDVRGHGHTGGSDTMPYSVDLFAADLDALLDALDITRAVVCGLSMGGAIAQAFAAAHPEKVAGLVLADTFPVGPLPVTGRLAMANIRFLARLDRFVGYKTLNRWQLRIAHRLLPGVSGDRETVQQLVDDAPTIPHAEFVKIADATARFPKADIDLSRVTAPTLVLHGEHLPTANEKTTERLIGQLSNTDPTVLVVPASGHASNLDNPEFFTTALREFIAERVYKDTAESIGDPEDGENSA
ncbi:alpha/beta hydrolase [Natronoglomus mannanivorans]|uniref:Alpha/beta hydrolase n=1 Tax=Natronoglomus mannanivorans TaxID=2979990 RepID=A0AAP2YWF6_9EURY|nr:alpha/beta hydrolase [Halobacteria archaeon AArc-xg1-1]